MIKKKEARVLVPPKTLLSEGVFNEHGTGGGHFIFYEDVVQLSKKNTRKATCTHMGRCRCRAVLHGSLQERYMARRDNARQRLLEYN